MPLGVRISRCRRLPGEAFRGYCAGKKQYFYGVRVQVVVTEDGVPVEGCFVPGAEHDSHALGRLLGDFQPGDHLYEDHAYSSYPFEDLAQQAGIGIPPVRRRPSARKDAPYVAYLKSHYRNRIESTISAITGLMPRALHCVSPKGFFIKALLFIMAYQFDKVV